jgi:hypothetical protein
MIAPAAFVGDPHDLGLTLSVNGTFVAAAEKIGDVRIEIAMSDSVYPRALTIPTR